MGGQREGGERYHLLELGDTRIALHITIPCHLS